jgi:hypothetical protein
MCIREYDIFQKKIGSKLTGFEASGTLSVLKNTRLFFDFSRVISTICFIKSAIRILYEITINEYSTIKPPSFGRIF